MQSIKGHEVIQSYSSKNGVAESDHYTNLYSEEVVRVLFDGTDTPEIVQLTSLEIVPQPPVSFVDACVMQDSFIFNEE